MVEPTSRRRPGPAPKPVHEVVRGYVRARLDAGQLAEATVPALRHTLSTFFIATGRPLAEVTRRDVEAWVGRPGLAASTRRRQLSNIRTFFGWAVEHGLVAGDPTAGVARIRVPRSLPRGLRADQVGRLLDVCPDSRARLIVLLEVQCGLRAVEVSRLRVDHVDSDERTLFVAAGKGGHQRLLPIPDEAWEALDAYRADHPEVTAGPLLRSYNEPCEGISAAHVQHLVQGWMKAAGIGAAGHALRHTFASDLVRRGVHLRDVQAALGHSNLATTSRYLPANVAELREAMGGRRYGAGAEEAQAVPGPVPALDAIGPLIDTVAALAAAVARIEARLDAIPGAPRPAEPPRPPVRERSAEHAHTSRGKCVCPLCAATWIACDALDAHLIRPHDRCPDCAGAFIGLVQHRRRAHRR